MNDNMKLYAVPAPNGMAIYLLDRAHRSTYVMNHRYSTLLFSYLKDGRSLREARRYRPDYIRSHQKLAHSLSHVLSVADWVLAEQVA